MTETEMKVALIHIKRHIYSKPIKKYIDNLLGTMASPLNSVAITHFKPVHGECSYAAKLYQVTYKMPVYKLDMRC